MSILLLLCLIKVELRRLLHVRLELRLKKWIICWRGKSIGRCVNNRSKLIGCITKPAINNRLLRARLKNSLGFG
jgi:hypothetical protein